MQTPWSSMNSHSFSWSFMGFCIFHKLSVKRHRKPLAPLMVLKKPHFWVHFLFFMTCTSFLDVSGSPFSHFAPKTLSVWHPLPRDWKSFLWNFHDFDPENDKEYQRFWKSRFKITISQIVFLFAIHGDFWDPIINFPDQNRFGAYFYALKHISELTFSMTGKVKSLNYC